MTHRSRALLVLPVLLAGLSGCASAASTDLPAPAPATVGASGIYDDDLSEHPTTYGTLGPGYPTPTSPPAPGGTFSPSPGAWSGVHPPSGYTVTALVPAGDEQAATVLGAVRSWAADESVALRVVEVATPDDNVPDLAAAMAAGPDLVVTTGDSLVGAMALVTASRPQQRFLLLGSELPEPTFNVTAVDWLGAGFRGEGLGQATHHDPASFTTERADRAVRAGVAAVLTNWSGTVVWVE